MRDCFDLAGRVAVVTGAGGALGSVMAAGLAAHGADVIVAGYKEKENVPQALDRIRSLGRQALEAYCDVRVVQF